MEPANSQPASPLPESQLCFGLVTARQPNAGRWHSSAAASTKLSQVLNGTVPCVCPQQPGQHGDKPEVLQSVVQLESGESEAVYQGFAATSLNTGKQR